jgi:hypothetical protein
MTLLAPNRLPGGYSVSGCIYIVFMELLRQYYIYIIYLP